MPNLFSENEIAEITAGFETSIRRFSGGDQHDGSKHTLLLGPIERLPAMCALLDEPRLLGLIGGVIGDDFNYSCGDGNYYITDSRWHADGHWGELFAVKVAFYLDPVIGETPRLCAWSPAARIRTISSGAARSTCGTASSRNSASRPKTFPATSRWRATPATW